ncbi:type II toxin-antitoxin system RelE/ParE family toxin [Tuwongella immobilis]|uniref:Plasmid stabilization system n=1 Tax=Tuwongella immobilis TaxID=692036 RepID=A0A6C2YHZ2_9BACT|nr:type II toxin-antitoxin system RelE/ParE family toxin [Tuwongella immobilis]VIP01158.1 Uncharacterized protein OS=Anabaena sp. 90 GN=ANA_C11883 PE=4 SV=1: Plasmid_stabil [Tuwongella immobilis]VTR97742.1 Uncharacterized protein OS=Anabaena sp. 90 GN=ANA_C11883 PE=4 SV=1: Plasmid_stabil [Tuwongella immobilis]
MNSPLQFHPATREEIREAYRWYEQQLTGLGQQFLDDCQNLFALIAESPLRFAFAEDDIREATLKRFPYTVYYRIVADHVRVLAIYHNARGNEPWRLRE